MKIKFGAIVVDGRGKLGGHVASKNKGGNYLRTKVTPTNPQTMAQSLARALFGAIAQQWSGLTEAVRNGWNEATADWQASNIFGDSKELSGKSLFQKLNNQAQSAGYPAVTTAPAKLEMVSGVVTDVLYDDLVNSEIVITGAYTGADARIVLLGTGPLSQGTKFVKNKLRQVYTAVGNAYNASDAFNAYSFKYGGLDSGANVYFAVKYVLPNGQVSPLQQIKGTVSV